MIQSLRLVLYDKKDHVKKEISITNKIRRLIKSNAVKIDNQSIKDEKYIINQSLFSERGFIKLSIGKKKHFKITN